MDKIAGGAKEIVVSGLRPTGQLHLGNYWGAVRNWIELQDKYECYFFVAGWHALTTGAAEKSGEIAKNTKDMLLDLLAVGLDTNKCIFFRQSDIKAHAELFLLLSMVMPINQLLRNPTFKEQLREFYNQKFKGQESNMPKARGLIKQLAASSGAEALALESDMAVLGFLAYPVLMAADIILYDAKYVPVGRDQLPHLEITRELVRRFNKTFNAKVFTAPLPLLTKSEILPGIDGRKMSKSYDNTILLCEETKSLEQKIKRMFTDPKKIKASDPGHIDKCVVYAFHRLYNPEFERLSYNCPKGLCRCSRCKQELFMLMDKALEKTRKRRAELEASADIAKIFSEGAKKAEARANKKIKAAAIAAGLA